MKFLSLVQYYSQLADTSKRLEKIEIVKNLLTELKKDELKPVVYMTTGSLGPDYDNLILGVKDSLSKQIVVQSTTASADIINQKFSEIGDIGDVIFELFTKGMKQGSLDDWFGTTESHEYSISEIWKILVEISQTEGKESTGKKLQLCTEVLQTMTPLEAKYFIRILVTKTRLGVHSPTFLEATANILKQTNVREQLDRAYYITSDIGLVVETALSTGLEAIRELQKPVVGHPIKCMAAEREKDASSILARLGGRCAVEEKYDGYRVQIHKSGSNVLLFSRNQESYTENFPDIVNAVDETFPTFDLICEGEIVAFDYEGNVAKPFQVLTKRSGKYNIEERVAETPVKVFLFDILYIDGLNLIDKPFPERRKQLEEIYKENSLIEIASLEYCETAEDLDIQLLKAKQRNAEGIMVKDIRHESYYQAGGRGFGWIKYKSDYIDQLADSFDLMVVGAYYGKGKRSGSFGTFLMAAWNEVEERYQTFCKVGSGLTEKDLVELKDYVEEISIQDPINDLDYTEVPDIWCSPEMILEVEGAEITTSTIHTVAGPDGNNLSLRFPRVKRRRTDKSRDYSGCTTVEEINKIYKKQFS